MLLKIICTFLVKCCCVAFPDVSRYRRTSAEGLDEVVVLGKLGLDFVSRRINSLKDMLTGTELKIAELLLDNPEEFVYLSVDEIADRSKTSISAVTRFTRKLGYGGLREFKLSLSKQLATSSVLGDIDPGDKTPLVMQKIFDANIEALQDTMTVQKAKDIEKCVELIDECTRMAFFGIGGSASVALDAHHKFMRTGKVVDVHTDPHKQMIFASLATPSILIVAISHEGASQDLNETLTIAKSNGASIIAITQFSNSRITKIADISLFTMSRETLYRPESLTSRIAAHTVTDLLYVSYAMRINDKMAQNISRIREGVKRLKDV